MSDLIKRSDAIATIGVMYERCDTYDITDYRDLMLEAVKVLPSADRPQGEWIVSSKDSICPICGKDEAEFICGTEDWYGYGLSNYCPNCGARMKGADDDQDI